MHPLTNRTCLVTGATGALGGAIAESLARRGADVVLVARDPVAADSVRERITVATGNPRVYVETADLGRRDEIKGLVQRFMDAHERLDVLVHAAGRCVTDRQVTPEGLELTWATNVLGPYQLTGRFMEILRYCRPSRVVFVASGHAGGLELADPEFKTRHWHGWTAYKASQQALRLLAWILAEGLERSDVTVNVVEPAAVRSHFFDEAPGATAIAARLYRKAAGQEATTAAEAVVRVAADPAFAGVTNKLFRGTSEAPCPFRSAELQQALFNLCVRTTRVQPEFDSNIWRDDDSMIVDARVLQRLV